LLRAPPVAVCALIISISIISIVTRWASNRQSHSTKYYGRVTLRHDSLTSLCAQSRHMCCSCSPFLLRSQQLRSVCSCWRAWRHAMRHSMESACHMTHWPLQ
jgi:hypothetical protein